MITIYPDPETRVLWEKFKAVAQRENKTASALLREVIREYLKVHGEGNPSFALAKWVADPEFKAFPSLGDTPRMKALEGMPDKDAELLRHHAQTWAKWAEDRLFRRPPFDQGKPEDAPLCKECETREVDDVGWTKHKPNCSRLTFHQKMIERSGGPTS